MNSHVVHLFLRYSVAEVVAMIQQDYRVRVSLSIKKIAEIVFYFMI